MSDRFVGVPRGRALRGSRKIAEYMVGDPDCAEIVCALPRDEFGIVKLGRELVAFSGWVDFALVLRAATAKGRIGSATESTT
jgi:hypothetical protein